MELSKLKPIDEASLQLKHPVTGELQEATFIVYGTDSKVYRQVLRDTMVKRMSSNKEATLDEIETDELNILATCTKSFSGLTENGNELIYSKEAVIKIYKDYSWIRDQVDMFISKKDNFFLKAT